MADLQMVVLVEVRIEWGEKRLYPHNNTAKLFTKLLGKKTIGVHDLAAIRDLGYTVTPVATSI